MSHANVEIVRRMYDAFRAGDGEGALACFHPDVEVDASERVDAERGRGRAELAAIIGSWIAGFEDWREEIEEIRPAGESVVVVATQRGRGRGSGIEVETRYAVLYDVADGAIVRMKLYPGLAEALDAAGA